MNVPLLAAMIALPMVAYEYSRNSSSSLARSDPCMSQYCPPTGYLIHVDKPVNTVMRDDALGETTLRGVWNSVARQYQREATDHPGVHLVAHWVP